MLIVLTLNILLGEHLMIYVCVGTMFHGLIMTLTKLKRRE